MKQLIIVRHAKSYWGNIELSDHDRPIKKAGIDRTKKVVEFFKRNEIFPEHILSSSALRAIQTASLISNGINYDENKIEKRKSLYLTDEESIFDEICSVSNSVNSLMLVAHNPTLTYFVNFFVDPKLDNLPTTGAVCIEFKTNSWENIVDAKFKVKFVVFPRML